MKINKEYLLSIVKSISSEVENINTEYNEIIFTYRGINFSISQRENGVHLMAYTPKNCSEGYGSSKSFVAWKKLKTNATTKCVDQYGLLKESQDVANKLMKLLNVDELEYVYELGETIKREKEKLKNKTLELDKELEEKIKSVDGTVYIGEKSSIGFKTNHDAEHVFAEIEFIISANDKAILEKTINFINSLK